MYIHDVCGYNLSKDNVIYMWELILAFWSQSKNVRDRVILEF